MVKAYIVDGDDLSDKKDKFVELFNDSRNTVQKIQEILKLTRNQYKRLRKECLNEGLIKTRGEAYGKSIYKPKYYYIARNGFYESYAIKKKRVYYGSVKTEQQAKKMVEMLKKCNWDKNRANDIRKKVLLEY